MLFALEGLSKHTDIAGIMIAEGMCISLESHNTVMSLGLALHCSSSALCPYSPQALHWNIFPWCRTRHLKIPISCCFGNGGSNGFTYTYLSPLLYEVSRPLSSLIIPCLTDDASTILFSFRNFTTLSLLTDRGKLLMVSLSFFCADIPEPEKVTLGFWSNNVT